MAEVMTLLPEAQPRAILFVPEGGADEIGQMANLASEAEVPLLLIDSGDGAAFEISGRLSPDASPEQIAAALHAVAVGLSVSARPSRRSTSSRSARASRESRSADDPLTDREMQVLQLVASELPNKGIVRRLNISEHTVKFHVGSILGKLGAASRTEAVTQAAHRGLLTL